MKLCYAFSLVQIIINQMKQFTRQEFQFLNIGQLSKFTIREDLILSWHYICGSLYFKTSNIKILEYSIALYMIFDIKLNRLYILQLVRPVLSSSLLSQYSITFQSLWISLSWGSYSLQD